jgi:hypothetical protein
MQSHHLFRSVFIACALYAAQVHAAPNKGEFTLVYACKNGDGFTIMVKPSDLKDVKQSWCRAIEYREAQDRPLLRCAGNVFTDEVLVKVENGCKEVTNDPLK